MIYLIYMSDLQDLDHYLYDLSVRSIWSRSWSIWSICPIYLFLIMIYPSDIRDLNHDLSDLSVRSIWSRSWSIWSIFPISSILIIIYLIHLSDLSDLDDDLYDQSVRSMSSRSLFSWSIFRSIWSISWSILSTCPLYLINIMICLSDLSDIDHDTSDLYVRSI